MKKIALVLFLLFSLCEPAYAVNFVEVNRDNDYLIYLDVDSIELRTSYDNEYVFVWTKWIPRGDRAKELSNVYKNPVDYEMNGIALNKNIKQIQPLFLVIFDKTGNVVDMSDWPFEMSKYNEVIPDTYGGFIYNSAMNYYNQNK